MKITLSLLICILFVLPDLFSQVSLEKRLEYSEDDKSYKYKFFSYGEEGGLIKYLVRNKRERTFITHLISVDELLNEGRKSSYSVSDQLSASEIYQVNNLLIPIDYSYKKGSYQLRIINRESLSIKLFEGKFKRRSIVKHISLLGDNLFVTTTDKKGTTLRIINIIKNEFKDIKINLDDYKNAYLSNVERVAIRDKEEYQVQFSFFEKDKASKHLVFRYSSTGELKKEPFIIDIAPDKAIVDMRFTYSEETDEFIIVGTYTANKKSGYANGMYTGRINEQGKVSGMKTYNFLELDHFTEFLSKKKLARLEKKKKRKEAKGNEFVYKGNAAVHNIYFNNGKRYLISEFYYATYRTESYSSNGQTYYRTVFDGYQYTHTLVAALDDAGELLWTHIFDMGVTQKPFYIKKFIRKNINEDGDLELSYANASGLNFITFTEDGDIKKERSYDFIKTEKEEEVVKYTINSNVVYWYDNYYVVSGFQKIKNAPAEKKKKRKRKIYFINLISY